MPAQLTKLRDLCLAQLPTVAPWACSRRLRMPNLKLVLFVLWANEGDPMPRARVVYLTGLSDSQVSGCLVALQSLGVVTRLPSLEPGRDPQPRYAVNTGRLREMVEPEPVIGTTFGFRLTAADAAKVRDLKARGVTVAQIAAKYHLSETHVHRIVGGRAWKERA